MRGGNETRKDREASGGEERGDRDVGEQAGIAEDRAPHRAIYGLHMHAGGYEEPHGCGAGEGAGRNQREPRAPAEHGADIRAERHANDRSDRPADEDEGDRAAPLLGLHEQRGGRCRLRREKRGADRGGHAHEHHRREPGDKRRGGVPGEEEQLHRGEQRAPVEAAGGCGKQRRGDADFGDLRQHAGDDQGPGADDEVAEAKREQARASRRSGWHERSFPAVGMTALQL